MNEFGDFVKGLYDDIKNATKTAAEKTQEAVEISKLRVEHMKLKGRIQSNYENLGEIVYGGYKNSEDVSDAVNVLFEQLDDDFSRIEEIYEEIENIKENGLDDEEFEEDEDDSEEIPELEDETSEAEEVVTKIKDDFEEMVD